MAAKAKKRAKEKAVPAKARSSPKPKRIPKRLLIVKELKVQPVEKDRTPTCIQGLDNLIQGGFESKSVVIVAGGPGTGKSLLGLQFLHCGITQEEENGMYITFEEQKEVVYRHAKKFGWDFEELERQKKFIFLEYPPHEVERFISEGGVIEDMINEYHIKRIVIDSMTSFLMIYDNDYHRRQAFLKVMDTLRKWGCTTVLISEGSVNQNGEVKTPFDIEHLSDGLIVLHTIKREDVVEIALEVVKMRGTAHERRATLLRFTEHGLTILPHQALMVRA